MKDPQFLGPRKRKSVRLRGYDYSSAGAYFVTVCTSRRIPILGTVERGIVSLNELGRVAEARWKWLPVNFPVACLDQFIVMPNHIHGIVWLRPQNTEGGSSPAPTTLMQVVGAFKTLSTREVNELRGVSGAILWQRSFYEHVVRDEAELT